MTQELNLPPDTFNFSFSINNIKPFNNSFHHLFINYMNQNDDNLLWNGFFINHGDYTKFYSHFNFM
jgi:hypothetical protein